MRLLSTRLSVVAWVALLRAAIYLRFATHDVSDSAATNKQMIDVVIFFMVCVFYQTFKNYAITRIPHLFTPHISLHMTDILVFL
jgi:hypothetical protein